MRKSKTYSQSVINCGNGQDAFLAYMAMFRYAFGRMTYMPSTVIGIIKRNAATLTDRTLNQLDRELTEEAEKYDRVYKDKHEHGSNYGTEYDRERWLAFHVWVKDQINKRSMAQ